MHGATKVCYMVSMPWVHNWSWLSLNWKRIHIYLDVCIHSYNEMVAMMNHLPSLESHCQLPYSADTWQKMQSFIPTHEACYMVSMPRVHNWSWLSLNWKRIHVYLDVCIHSHNEMVTMMNHLPSLESHCQLPYSADTWQRMQSFIPTHEAGSRIVGITNGKSIPLKFTLAPSIAKVHQWMSYMYDMRQLVISKEHIVSISLTASISSSRITFIPYFSM